MCLFFVFGEEKFRRRLDGYDDVRVQCYNCGNWSANVRKTHPFFTLCWVVSWFCVRTHARTYIYTPYPYHTTPTSHPPSQATIPPLTSLSLSPQPIIPLSLKGEVDVHCNTCGWDQAIEKRPDVQAMRKPQPGQESRQGAGGVPLQNTHNGPSAPPPPPPGPHQQQQQQWQPPPPEAGKGRPGPERYA
jgi:hypothetical protein